MGEEQKSNKAKWGIAGIVLIIIAGALFYFLYWVKTPAYSLGIIKTSVEKHDLVKFEQHVDMNSLYGRAFDSFIGKELQGNDNALILGIVKAMRGIVVDELTNQTKKYVETGSFEKPANNENKNTAGKENNTENNGKAAAQALSSRTNAQGMEYKGVEKTEKDGKIAVVSLKMNDKQLKKDFILKVKMRELDNGEWTVVEIANLEEFLAEHDQAVREKLAELNKPIKEKMDSVLKVTNNISARLRDTNPFFQSQELSYSIGMILPDKSNKVSDLYGKFIMTDSAGKNVLVCPTHFWGVQNNYSKENYSPTKEYIITAKKYDKLNPFISEEKKIMDAGISAYKLNFTVTKLVMVDGSTIELATKLPEN